MNFNSNRIRICFLLFYAVFMVGCAVVCCVYISVARFLSVFICNSGSYELILHYKFLVMHLLSIEAILIISFCWANVGATE
jgi:hypothetical protein